MGEAGAREGEQTTSEPLKQLEGRLVRRAVWRVVSEKDFRELNDVALRLALRPLNWKERKTNLFWQLDEADSGWIDVSQIQEENRPGREIFSFPTCRRFYIETGEIIGFTYAFPARGSKVDEEGLRAAIEGVGQVLMGKENELNTLNEEKFIIQNARVEGKDIKGLVEELKIISTQTSEKPKGRSFLRRTVGK